MSDLIISGVIDGPLSGGVPKAIELYAVNDIPDLSIYGVESANNGNSSTGAEFTFPAVSVTAGTYLYIASEDTGFTNYFGFAPDYTSGALSINGDDAIALFQNGAIIDVFGVIGVDGTGEPWEHLDGWAYRVANTGPNGSTFELGNWTFSGINALDGETSNATAATPFPLATFDFGTTGGGGGTPAPNLNINELRISSPGSSDNTSNFVELFGDANTSLEGLSVVVVSGEFEPGQVDFVFDLTGQSTDENGFFLISNDASSPFNSFDFFGSPSTFLLVDSFTGSQGDDLDSDNDGNLDSPIGTIVDSVSLIDGDINPDANYSDTVIGPDGSFTPAGVAREVDGTGNFVQLDFGDLTADTPGFSNEAPPPPVDITPIYEIQGASHVSPFVLNGQTVVDFFNTLPADTLNISGDSVTTTGIVTAVDSNGFYLQDPTGDGEIATSDAIFVFTGSNPGVSVGDELEVSGTVSEFFPGDTDTRNLPTTQISGNLDITVLSSGNALPDAVILGQGGRVPPSENIDDDAFGSFDPTMDGIDFFESLEGMRVTAQDVVAVSGTNRFGEIFTVVDRGASATGLSDRGTLNISPNDFNPEKIQIDEDSGIFDFAFPDVDAGALLGDVTGVIGYSFGNFEILPTEDFTANITPSNLTPETTSIIGDEDELTVASYNVLNLDPNDSDGDTDIADGRFAAIAQQIVNNLKAPDVLGLQEIQDNSGSTDNGIVAADQTLQTLVDAIVAAGGPQYQFIDNPFIGNNTSGGQPGGNIRTAFLYNPNRVDLVENSIRTIGSQDDGEAFDGARLPIVADFEFNGQVVTVVNNHFSSKGGSAPILGIEQPFDERQEDVSVNGSLDERQAQSAAVQNFVSNLLANDPNANVAVVGDFNEFEFVSPVTGLESAGLTNLTNTLPENERYSFIFQGNSQSLDHILVSNSLLDGAEFDVVYTNSEFAETSSRASDHDPLVASFVLKAAAAITNQTTIKGAPINDLVEDNTLGELIQSFGEGGPNGFVNIGSKLKFDKALEHFLFNDQIDAAFQTTNGIQGIDGIRIQAIADNSKLAKALNTDSDATTTSYMVSVEDNDSLVASRTAGWDVGDFAAASGNPEAFDDGVAGVNDDGTTIAVFENVGGGLTGTNFRDVFVGGDAEDFFSGNNGDDVIQGKAGDDKLLGQNGNDNIAGGLGKDQIRGGNGDDLLRGGNNFGSFGPEAGDGFRDTFVFEAVGNGNDRITDFELKGNGFSGDRLAFRIDNAGKVELGDHLNGNGDLVITISNFVGQTGSITLDDIDTADEFNAIAGQIQVWGNQSKFSTNFDIIGVS